MGTETELKLKLDPTALAAVARHPLIRRLKAGPATAGLQKTVYFDTEDLFLRRSLVALRIRHIGGRRIQTVKTYGQCRGGAWSRGEWETEIASDAPDLSVIQDPEIAGLFAGHDRLRTLAPVFVTEIKRTSLLLRNEAGVVELALDEGRISARGGAETISEAELELVSGSPSLLFQLAAGLLDDIAFRLGRQSKADRGYALFEGRLPGAVKAESVEINATDPARDAFRRIAWSCLSQILANQECLEETADPEAVHQMRVGLRRLRSAIGLFKKLLAGPETETVRQELRWLQGHLGPARDLDVFIGDIIDPLASLLKDEAGYRGLAADFDAERSASYDIARQVLSLPRYTRLLLTASQWIESGGWLFPADAALAEALARPVGTLARSILSRHERHALESLRHLEALDDHARHLGRIEVKKLRYATEFFAALEGRDGHGKIPAVLARLQDRLGLLNDISNARAVLRQKAMDSGDPARLWAAGLITGWHEARVGKLLNEATADLASFAKLARLRGRA